MSLSVKEMCVFEIGMIIASCWGGGVEVLTDMSCDESQFSLFF